jgi:hypothetical protein
MSTPKNPAYSNRLELEGDLYAARELHELECKVFQQKQQDALSQVEFKMLEVYQAPLTINSAKMVIVKLVWHIYRITIASRYDANSFVTFDPRVTEFFNRTREVYVRPKLD